MTEEKTLDAEVFNSAVKAYIGDEVEVNLPEWSGRMNKAYALAELARLKEFISQVESALVGTDTSQAALSVPAGDVTDSAAADESWRAEVVAAALDEDKSLSQLHDEHHKHWKDWEDDGDYGYGPYNNPFPVWLKLNYPKAYLRYLVLSQRRNKKMRREIACTLGARPYQAAYQLAGNIVVFEGEIHRVISIGDDIPF